VRSLVFLTKKMSYKLFVLQCHIDRYVETSISQMNTDVKWAHTISNLYRI